MNKLCWKIKQSLCIGLIIFGIFQVRSQAERPIDTSKQKQSYLLEDIIQSYVESRADDGNFDYNTLADRLEYLQSHPVNINSPDQIDDLVLLTPSQIINIKNYILQHGELISIYELQAVPGMDINSIKMIMPFVRLNSNFENYNVPLVEMLRFGDNQLFLRTGSYFQKSVGYDHSRSSFYNGSPQRFYMRFKHFYENKLSIGLTAEKDPGEEFFKGSNKQGFDYYSFHFALRNINKTIQDIVIGDYNVSFGQGLIIHSGFGIGKSPWATSIRKADRTIRPYTSVNESNFLRGAAANLRFTKKFDATLFASRRRKDGNVINDSLDRETLFSSFQESGYHRTSNEIADENAITENTAGGAIRYKTGHGHIGLNTMYTEFGKGLLKQNLPYNQFAFKGQRLFQYSVDHSYQIKNFNFFGEAAFSNPGTYGWMEGLHLVLDKNVDMAFLYRHLDRAYPALYSNAFTENTLANNERGLYIGTEVRPSTRWK
ncbi:MAG: helix-hairpin-helix domain-containing protein, partial [Saprospiraceae bacterium]